jgi:hypothetical protein
MRHVFIFSFLTNFSVIQNGRFALVLVSSISLFSPIVQLSRMVDLRWYWILLDLLDQLDLLDLLELLELLELLDLLDIPDSWGGTILYGIILRPPSKSRLY